ncbi:hypothetical protein P7C70_g301, partial [Phenoliferia sp. Uapishka_3]
MSATATASTNLLYRDLHGRAPEIVVGAKGSFLELDDGRRILDACAGAAVASIGHGDERVISAITKQLTTLSYHHTSRLTNKVYKSSSLNSAPDLVADIPFPFYTGRGGAGTRARGSSSPHIILKGGLSHAIFLSSGSEANESALKLVRQYFVETGQPDRVNIISRHNSYHGNSLGCVSLTGIPSRRRHFEPMLLKTITRVSPCYPYRHQLENESDLDYSQRLAEELEAEIIRLGPGSVCAFFAETVVGAAAGNLTPVPGYFKAIRKVCDKYGMLLVLDEVMCGMGRTGKLHAWEHEGITPDVQTIGKGLNGGYQALSAVLMQQHVVDGLKKGTGAFANGQTYQSHPAAAAAGLAVMKIFKEDRVVENCAEMGAQPLNLTTPQPPSGRGLFLSIEFVTSRLTKSTFPSTLPIALLLDDAMFSRGVSIYSGFGKGTADGVVGDHILFSPPLTVRKEEVEMIVRVTKEAVEEVFRREDLRDISQSHSGPNDFGHSACNYRSHRMRYGSVKITSSLSWRLPFAIATAISSSLTIGALFIPYSPRWLMMKGRRAEAESVMDLIAPATDASSNERRELLEVPHVEKVGAMEMFGKGVRGRTWLGVFLQASNQLTGIYTAEIQPNRTRAAATAFGNGVNQAVNFVVAVTGPGFLAKSAYGPYFTYGSFTAFATVIAYLYMGWRTWAKQAAKGGYTSLLVEVDPENAKIAPGSSSADMLESLSTGALPLRFPTVRPNHDAHAHTNLQLPEFSSIMSSPDLGTPFPPLLISSHLSTLLAQSYVSSHPLSGLLLHSPIQATAVHKSHPSIFSTGPLAEFDFEPNFPVGIMWDSKGAEEEGLRSGNWLVDEFSAEEDRGEVRVLRGGKDKEGWKEVLEWMDESGL